MFQIALFAILSPFAVIGPFSALTEGYSSRTRSKVAARVGYYSFLILIVVAWAGELVLKFLGISIQSLEAAGGLVLILSSLPMILKGEAPRKKVRSEDEVEITSSNNYEEIEKGWENNVVSPLVFPLTIGAGSISLVITQVGQVAGIGDRLAVTVCLVIHGLIILATYLLAASLSVKLSEKGTAVVTRVGGIILLCLAFEIFCDGIRQLLPGLA